MLVSATPGSQSFRGREARQHVFTHQCLLSACYMPGVCEGLWSQAEDSDSTLGKRISPPRNRCPPVQLSPPAPARCDPVLRRGKAE